MPGRFRYDKDSEEDEQVNYYYNSHHTQQQNTNNYNENELAYDQNENNDSGYHVENNLNENSNEYKQEQTNNYRTYREECTKLMSNDAYDPNAIGEPTQVMPEDFDLRNFLRNKASQQQLQQSQQHELVYDNGNSPNEIVYTEPITRPIEIQRDYYFKRYRHNKAFHNRHLNESFNVTNTYKLRNSVEYNKNLSNSDSDGDESDDDHFLKSKKIKSVVIVKKPDKGNSLNPFERKAKLAEARFTR